MSVTVNGNPPTNSQVKDFQRVFCAPVQISFTSNVPFDGYSSMPQQAVTAPMTFTPNQSNAMVGANTYVRLISNGSIVPVFSGFIEDGSSHGWGAPNGTVNRVFFWFDGTSYYYSIQQEAGLPVVTPVLVSAVIQAAAPSSLVLTYSVPLDAASVPSAAAFSVTNSGGSFSVSSVSVSGSTVTLGTSRAASASEVISISYAVPGSGQIKSASGGLAAALSGASVTNNVVAADGTTFVNLVGLTEADAGGGYKTYTVTGSPAGWAQTGYGATKKLQSSPASNVFLQAKLSRTLLVLGLHTDNSTDVNIFSPISYYVWRDAGQTQYQLNGGFTSSGAVYTGADGDTIRFQRTSTNTLTVELSQDNGGTWTVLGTKTGVAGDLFPRLNANATASGGAFTSVKCNGAAI